MYPYDILPGFDLYSLFFLFALCASILSFRIISDKVGLEVGIYNLCIYSGIVAIAGGYPSAMLLQAFYDYLATGTFEVTSGLTFYGGFIGGALTFLIMYFGVGHFLDKEKLRAKRFFFISDIAACSVVLAHAIGRIGCIFAGCCHGAVTGAWFGIYNETVGAKTVPVPLFESLFLFALFAFLYWRVTHERSYNLPIYLTVYGVWRFFIEYIRFDDRGETVVSFLSPSQLVAVVLFIIGVALFIFMHEMKKRTSAAPEEEQDDDPAFGDEPPSEEENDEA